VRSARRLAIYRSHRPPLTSATRVLPSRLEACSGEPASPFDQTTGRDAPTRVAGDVRRFDGSTANKTLQEEGASPSSAFDRFSTFRSLHLATAKTRAHSFVAAPPESVAAIRGTIDEQPLARVSLVSRRAPRFTGGAKPATASQASAEITRRPHRPCSAAARLLHRASGRHAPA
jgi:hypothetical protein